MLRKSLCLFSLLFLVSLAGGEVESQSDGPSPEILPALRASLKVPESAATEEAATVARPAVAAGNLEEKTPQTTSVALIHPRDPPAACDTAAKPLADWLCGDGKDGKKFPTFRVTGFFHLDGARFSQDPVNIATVGDVQDGIGFRRARIGTTGNLTENTTYMMEFDFADFQARFVDVWVDFAKVPFLGNVRIGRWRQPFGMAELTGIRDLPFLERELGFTFAPFRQTGIGFYDHNEAETATWALSGYRFLTDFFGNTVGDDGGYGLAGRFTFLPLELNDDSLLHCGLGYAFQDPAMDNLFFGSPPEVFVGQSIAGVNPAPIIGTPLYVNTGIIPLQAMNLFNLELAAVHGNVAFQTEARWARLELRDGSTRTLPAWTAHVRYVLTGENIPYVRKNGVFGRVKPRNPVDFASRTWGAWEIAARWSYIDLNGTQGTGPGRRLNDLTLGLNWYVNNLVKFQFNYIHAFLDDPVLGASDTDIFALRCQMDF